MQFFLLSHISLIITIDVEQPKEKRSPKAASPEGVDSSVSLPAEMNGLPKLLNLRHMPSSSIGG
jgi:hypothetical protein